MKISCEFSRYWHFVMMGGEGAMGRWSYELMMGSRVLFGHDFCDIAHKDCQIRVNTSIMSQNSSGSWPGHRGVLPEPEVSLRGYDILMVTPYFHTCVITPCQPVLRGIT